MQHQSDIRTFVRVYRKLSSIDLHRYGNLEEEGSKYRRAGSPDSGCELAAAAADRGESSMVSPGCARGQKTTVRYDRSRDTPTLTYDHSKIRRVALRRPAYGKCHRRWRAPVGSIEDGTISSPMRDRQAGALVREKVYMGEHRRARIDRARAERRAHVIGARLLGVRGFWCFLAKCNTMIISALFNIGKQQGCNDSQC